MGAMHNDLERCAFMFSKDRRCRNLIHTPGSPFCFFHANGVRRKRKPASANAPAERALFQWLTTHPLDNVTNVNHALNLITLLLADQRISVRRANALQRLLRAAMKSVSDIHDEFTTDSFRSHWPQGRRFLEEVQPLLAAVALEPADAPLASPAECGPAAAATPRDATASSNESARPVPVSSCGAAVPPVSASTATQDCAASAPHAVPAATLPAARGVPKAAPHRVPAVPLSRARIRSLIRAALADGAAASPDSPASAAHGPRKPET